MLQHKMVTSLFHLINIVMLKCLSIERTFRGNKQCILLYLRLNDFYI